MQPEASQSLFRCIPKQVAAASGASWSKLLLLQVHPDASCCCLRCIPKQVAAASGASHSKVQLLQVQPDNKWLLYKFCARSRCSKQLHETCVDTTVLLRLLPNFHPIYWGIIPFWRDAFSRLILDLIVIVRMRLPQVEPPLDCVLIPA